MEPPPARDARLAATDATDQPDEADIGSVQIGTILDGKYQITARIASGGMGSVYRGRHTQIGNDVAIKILHPRYAADPDGVKRFQREARVISGLRHPNILSVYAFGSVNGLLYMAMEWIEGTSLGQLVDDNGPLSAAAAVPLLMQICEAMAFAHQSDVYHRDLKPDNIIVVPQRDGSRLAKIIDFGLAKLLDGTEGQRLTKTGEVLGDPSYMSPEQAQGQKMDNRSDIYSFGCLMYEVLTGAPPFVAESPVAVLFKQVSDQPAPFAQRNNLPQALETITLTCMAKNREQRYGSFDAVQEVLQQFTANPAVKLQAPSTSGLKTRSRRKSSLVGLVALACIGAAVAAIWLHLRYVERQADTDNQQVIEEEELRAFAVDSGYISDTPSIPIEKLLQLEHLAKRLSNKRALAKAKRLQAYFYLHADKPEQATAAALKALDMHLGPEADYQQIELLELAAQSAKRSKQDQLAETLYGRLFNESKGYYSHRQYHIEHGVSLAITKADLGKQKEALALCDKLQSELWALQDSSTEDKLYPATSLCDLYRRLGKLDRAEAVLGHVNSDEFVKNGDIRLIAYSKSAVLLQKHDYAGLEKFKKQILSKPIDPMERLEFLEYLARGLGTMKQDQSSARIQQEMLDMSTTPDRFGHPISLAVQALGRIWANEQKGDYGAVARDGSVCLKLSLREPGQSSVLIACRDSYVKALQKLGRPNEIEAIEAQVRNYIKTEMAAEQREHDRIHGSDRRYR